MENKLKKYVLVYHETIRIEREVMATSPEDAINVGEAIDGWEDCSEETEGTGGVDEVYDGDILVFSDGKFITNKKTKHDS